MLPNIKIKSALYWILGIFLIWLSYQIVFLPSGKEFKAVAPHRSALMVHQEQSLSKYGVKALKYNYVPLNKISPSFRLAVLVAEDFDFPEHSGFALYEIYNSIRSALINFRIPRGASTITQQLAKNLYLSPSKSPFRKINEAIITVKLERTLSKQRIFELYLNIVELGPGIFGAEAASRYWFSKSAADLTLTEAAKLAAILPGPNSVFNPVRNPSRVSKRQQLLIRRITMTKAKLPKGL